MSVPVTMLARAEAYLAERRRLGFVLDWSGSLTRAFRSLRRRKRPRRSAYLRYCAALGEGAGDACRSLHLGAATQRTRTIRASPG